MTMNRIVLPPFDRFGFSPAKTPRSRS